MRVEDLTKLGDPLNSSLNTPVVEEEQKKPPKLEELITLVGRPLRLTMPEGEISLAGHTEISRLVGVSTNWEAAIPLYESDPKNFEWLWLTKKGTLPKRLRKYLNKHYPSVIIPDSLIVEVGNIAKRHASESLDYFFEITNVINWGSTDFGQSRNGSCWWSGGPNDGIHSTYYKLFLAQGGLAVKFFSQDEDRSNYNGIGRIWLQVEPYEQKLAYLFNGYWREQGATLRLVRVLAHFLGLEYIRFTTPSGHRYYMNGNHGYILGNNQDLQGVETYSIHVPFKEPLVRCFICKGEFKSTNMINFTFSDGSICEQCYKTETSECGHCGSREVTKELTKVNYPPDPVVRYGYYGRRSKRIKPEQRVLKIVDFCRVCVRNSGRSLVPCASCNLLTYFSFYNGITIDKQVRVCTACELSIPKCQDCRARTFNEDAMGNPVCLPCEADFEREITTDVPLNDPSSYDCVLWDEDSGCQCSGCLATIDRISSRSYSR